MPSIRALTAEAKAALLEGEMRIKGAILELQGACHLWAEAGSILNCGATRLWLATLLLASGDRTGAEVEVKAVATIAERTGSPRLARRCLEFESIRPCRVMTAPSSRPTIRRGRVASAFDPGRTAT